MAPTTSGSSGPGTSGSQWWILPAAAVSVSLGVTALFLARRVQLLTRELARLRFQYDGGDSDFAGDKVPSAESAFGNDETGGHRELDVHSDTDEVDEDWNDADNPISETLCLLRKLASGRELNLPLLREEAKKLIDVVKRGNLQLPSSLATLSGTSAGGTAAAHDNLPVAVRYFINLRSPSNDRRLMRFNRDSSYTDRSEGASDFRSPRVSSCRAPESPRHSERGSSSSSFSDGSLSETSASRSCEVAQQQQQQQSSTLAPCSSQTRVKVPATATTIPEEGPDVMNGETDHFDISSLLLTPSASIGRRPNLDGLGESFFFNVQYLRKYGVEQPLTFVTHHILVKSGVVRGLRLNEAKLLRYLNYVEQTYYPTNPYHNSWHAADVTQRCAAIVNALNLPNNRHTRMHRLAVILAATIHDAGHPGVDNNFMIQHEDDLARTFNDQHVLEMHSLNVSLCILRDRPEMNFLEGSVLSGKSSWLLLKSAVTKTVLATDMGQHFDLIAKFSTSLADLRPDHEDYEKRVNANLHLVLQLAMKAADLGHCASRWATHLYWCKCLEEEFFAQGDLERSKGVATSPMMDRSAPGCMSPTNQVGFYRFIVMPLFTKLGKAFPGTLELMCQAGANFRQWKALKAQAELEECEPLPLTLKQYLKKMMSSSDRLHNSLIDKEDLEVKFPCNPIGRMGSGGEMLGLNNGRSPKVLKRSSRRPSL